MEYAERHRILSERLGNATQGLDTIRSGASPTGRVIAEALLSQVELLRAQVAATIQDADPDGAKLSVIENQYQAVEQRVVAYYLEADPLVRRLNS